MQKNYNIVGKSLPRSESVAKVTGTAEYTSDLVLPGMVYGKILRSPYAHARVKGIDVAEARRVPGVLGILTYKDVPDTLYNCSGTPPSPMVVKDERILTAEPKHVGDRVAAVVAVNERVCDEALAKIRVEYETLPHVFEIEDALQEDAPLVHADLFPGNIAKKMVAEEGDVEKGLKEADHVWERVYRTPAVQHVALEPTGCICHYTSDGNLRVWSTSQTPHHDRRILADLTGLPQNKVHITKPVMGGGFGARQQLHHQPVGALLSKLVRRPVKMIYDREEEMYASAVRHASLIKVRAGVNNDGRLLAVHFEAYLNTGGYITQGPIVLAAMSRKMQYNVPHYRFEGYCVYTNAPVAGAMRGYGNPQLNFARETLINEICAQMEWDPLQFRLRNHLQVGDKIPALNYPVQSCAIEECAGAALDMKAKFEEKGAEENKLPENNNSGRRNKRAWGLAFASHGSGITERDQGTAAILVNDDGSVNLLVGSPDIGQGSDTIFAQIVAEELGIEADRVALISADTAHTPYDTGTFASRQAYVSGNAVLLAARDVQKELIQRLCSVYSVAEEEVSIENNTYRIKAAEGVRELTFAEAVRQSSFGAAGRAIVGRSTYKPESSPPPFAVCLAEVEVDGDTGNISVPRVIMAVDAGNPLNPSIVEGQVQGGVSMGVGYALYETVRQDRKHNRPLEADLLHYKVQFSVDSPDIKVYLADGYEPSGPFGAKSVGELPTIPVAAAIVHAVYKATGCWVSDLPLVHSSIGLIAKANKNSFR